MKETRTINLNGQVYHIDYDAYQNLRDYLQDIEMRLPASDKSEVMEDVEARVAELFQKALFAKNVQVIEMQMVESVKTQIGAPSEFGANARPKVKLDKSENSGCGRVLRITLQVLLVLMALPVLGTLLTVIFSLLIAFTGVTLGLGTALPFLPTLSPLSTVFSPAITSLAILCVVLLVGVPIVMLVHTIVVYIRTRRGPKARFWWTTLILWLIALVGMGSLATHVVTHVDMPALQQAIDQLEDVDELVLNSETRVVDAFNGIDVTGAAQINIHQDAVQQLAIQARNLSDVVTEVRDGILYIYVPNKSYEPMVLDVAVPVLSSIRAMGACSIENDSNSPLQVDQLTLDLSGAAEADLELQLKTLKVTARGASSLDLSGEAEQSTITLEGAGDIDAEALLTECMHINCSGASEAEIYVTKELWAQASGASKISYKGNPQIKQKMAVGGSSIKKG